MSRDRNPDYSLSDAIVETEPFITALLGEQPKLKRFKQVYMGYRIARPIYTLLTKKPVKISNETTYTFKLEYGSHMYKLLSDWMRENLEEKQLNTFEVEDSWQWVRRPQEGDRDFTLMDAQERAAAAKAHTESLYEDDEDAADKPIPTAVQARIPMFLFKAEHPKKFKYNDQWITLDPTGGEDSKTTNGEGQEIVGPQWHNDIALIAHGEHAKEAIENLMTDLLMGSQHFGSGVRPNVPNDVYMMKRASSEWRWRAHVPPRNFKNVFLNAGLAETLCADIKDFMDLRPSYERVGLPYHRGYLLYGPPGTGKTSVVQALANKFNLNLYCLALGDVKNDSELAELFANVTGNKSLILIEDIDVIHMSMNRAGDDKGRHDGISLSGFLNVIDGVTSANGTILVMTTNDKKVPDPENPEKMIFERLDEALVRPGRVDFELEIGYVDENQYRGFFNLFYEQDPITDFAEFNFHEIAPVHVLEGFKRYPLDIAKADEFLRAQFGRDSDPTKREKLSLRTGTDALLGKNREIEDYGDDDDLGDLVKLLSKPNKAAKPKKGKKAKNAKKSKKAKSF